MSRPYVVSYDAEQVEAALNRACNDILDAAGLPDSGCADALNLLVNAALCYLTGTADSLTGVAAANYSTPLPDILGWIREA